MFDQQWSPDTGASVADSGPGAEGSAVELLEQLQGTLKALAAVDLGACDPEDLAVLTVGLARAEAMVVAQSAPRGALPHPCPAPC